MLLLIVTPHRQSSRIHIQGSQLCLQPHHFLGVIWQQLYAADELMDHGVTLKQRHVCKPELWSTSFTFADNCCSESAKQFLETGARYPILVITTLIAFEISSQTLAELRPGPTVDLVQIRYAEQNNKLIRDSPLTRDNHHSRNECNLCRTAPELLDEIQEQLLRLQSWSYLYCHRRAFSAFSSLSQAQLPP